jgi:hypothetical protein
MPTVITQGAASAKGYGFGASSAPPVYIEDVFSTYLYTGNGSTQKIENGVNLNNTEEALYTNPGTYSFKVPPNVTSLQAVAIGAGGGNGFGTAAPFDGDGGGGGALVWATIPVTPGETLTVRCGASTLSNGSAGLSSYIYRGAARLIEANSGTTGYGETGSGGPGGAYSVGASIITYGGGNGGAGRAAQDGVGVGGGSAGTYAGNGASGSGTLNGTGSNVYGSTVSGGVGTAYGWGRKADDGPTQLGGGGAVRILWGSGRSFPSTNVSTTLTYSNLGGLVWMKGRSGATDHALYDTARGATYDIASNLNTAQTAQPTGLTAFETNGFIIGSLAKINTNAATYASWSFRKQPKFFDVVTYTGNGANRTIAHNLGSVPGCIMIKRTDTTAAWAVYHRSLANTQYMVLNIAAAAATGATYWNSTTPTSSVFSLGTSTDVNASGGTYVAYLFAHDAGGFGLTGTDNVISCGSFTTSDGVSGLVNIGFEPQWVFIKRTDSATLGDWQIYDNMRGVVASNNGPTYSQPSQKLLPNSSAAETTDSFGLGIYQQGFNFNNASGISTYIYIAIRRGPMKTPTLGTSVFGLNARTGTGANATVTGGLTADAALIKIRDTGYQNVFCSRLTGTGYLSTSSTAAEVAAGTTILQPNPWDVMDGVKIGTTSALVNSSGSPYINYLLRRAPGFFDVVCYTGNGDNTNGITISHNLGVAPQVIICKRRSAVADWYTSWAPILGYGTNNEGYLNTTASFINGGKLANAPTATTFKWTDASGLINASGSTYVAYLFATVAGVSKVGSYTGTGTTKQIDCGFTGGARFVLIKRTDSTGDWYVWDSARGIVAGNDPYLLLNSAAAEVTGTDYVDTYSAGFEISSTAPAAINANGGSFIFLAIA